MQITQEQYEKIAKYLPRQRGNVSMSNLQLLNAILYVTENGCKWRPSVSFEESNAFGGSLLAMTNSILFLLVLSCSP